MTGMRSFFPPTRKQQIFRAVGTGVSNQTFFSGQKGANLLTVDIFISFICILGHCGFIL
jgi:hypothetical protein